MELSPGDSSRAVHTSPPLPGDIFRDPSSRMNVEEIIRRCVREEIHANVREELGKMSHYNLPPQRNHSSRTYHENNHYRQLTPGDSSRTPHLSPPVIRGQTMLQMNHGSSTYHDEMMNNSFIREEIPVNLREELGRMSHCNLPPQSNHGSRTYHENNHYRQLTPGDSSRTPHLSSLVIGGQTMLLTNHGIPAYLNNDKMNSRFASIPFLREEEIHANVREELGQMSHYNLPPQRLLPDQNIQPRYQLQFINKVKDPTFTTKLVRDNNGDPIRVEIYDSYTRSRVSPYCSISSAKVRISALDADFWKNRVNRSRSEFVENVLRGREGKGPILIGHSLTIQLENGVGTFENIVFNDNSSWTKSGFRLGVMVEGDGEEGYLNVERVQEGVSEPFWVKDRRGKASQKPKRLKVTHSVRCIKKTGKNLAPQKKRINTVQELHKSVREEICVREELGKRSNYNLPPPRPLPDQNMQARYRLQFINKVKDPTFTTDLVRDNNEYPIEVAIDDSDTQSRVSHDCFLSSAKVRITVLNAGLWENKGENWSRSEFNQSVLKEREGKGPILIGPSHTIQLENGVGTFRNIVFNDNSSWTKSGFRLGVMVEGEEEEGYLNGERVQEGVSEPFRVKDRRGKATQKPDLLKLTHSIQCIKKIGKDRACLLQKEDINTVEDFLKLYYNNEPALREILGIKSESDKGWMSMVEHVVQCADEFHGKYNASNNSSHPRQVREEIHVREELGQMSHYNLPPQRLLPDQNIQPRYQLQFINKVKDPTFTTKLVRDNNGDPIRVEIYDSYTRSRVSPYCSISSAKVRISALDADFWKNRVNRSRSEFVENVLRGREGKGPILIGHSLTIQLENGVGTFEIVFFNDNSSWTKCGFRLGVMVEGDGEDGYLNGERVQEGVSEPFQVRDRRMEASQKPDRLKLTHKVQSLKKVGKDRASLLQKKSINTVEDFLKFYYNNGPALREILGIKSESDKGWMSMVEHAMQCADEFRANTMP